MKRLAALTLLTFSAPHLLLADDETPSVDQEVAILEPTLLQAPPSFDQLQPPPSSFSPNLGITVGLSVAPIPGLSHVYLGDYQTAGRLFGTSLALLAGAFANIEFKGPKAITAFSATALSDLYMYNTYAAYRDLRGLRNHEGFKYPMPTESLAELARAPFQWSVIKKPEVWGGVLLALTASITLTQLMPLFGIETNRLALSESTSEMLLTARALSVGVGEEALFRGFLQPIFSEYLTPYGGIAASSLAFGAAHIPNARSMPSRERSTYYKFGIPFLTVSGVYFGWLAHKNGSLKESVAVHTWYDFTLFMLSAVAQSSFIRAPSFTIGMAF